MTQWNQDRVASPAGHVHGTSKLMLIELKKVRDELLSAICAMDAVTGKPGADRYQVSTTRWRLSQAGLKGCTAWGIIFPHLLPRVGTSAAVALQSLQRDHLEVLRHSSVHIGEWTLDRIEADWSAYREAYRSIRSIMTTYVTSEKRILYPMLREEALGAAVAAEVRMSALADSGHFRLLNGIKGRSSRSLPEELRAYRGVK